MMNSRAQGFSLPELLVVIVVGAIVLGAVYQTMAIQERANRQQLAIATTEQSTRMALDVMMSELREASATDGDLLEATPTSVRFRALQKAGVVCSKYSADRAYIMTPVNAPEFDNGDQVQIFADGDVGSARDDGWISAEVNATPEANDSSCPGLVGWGVVKRVKFTGLPLVNVDSGALVRSFKAIRYQLVDRGSGAVLERQEADQTPVALVDSLTSIANGGLRLRYFKVDGTEITNPNTPALLAEIMRIELKVRARAIGGQTGTAREFTDSLVHQVTLRGNYRTL